jgi:hypothetical protein
MRARSDIDQLKWNRWIWLIPLLLIGFWLRLTFLVGNVYYGDEFISMLAIKMVAERGLPIFPSGLFYDHGFLYSMLAGLFVAVLGFSEQVARWPVLLVSMFTIAAYYAVARRLFDSHLTGVIVAILVTFDTFSMKWGVWARMYAQAHLFVLLSVAWLVLTTLKRPSPRQRWLFLLFLAGALFSHSLIFLVLPSLALLLLIFLLIYRRGVLRDSILWLQVGLAAIVMAAAFAIASAGSLGSFVSLQDRSDPAAELPSELEPLQGFFLLNIDESDYEQLFNFFRTPSYTWLLYVIGAGLFIVLYRFFRRRATFADIAFLFMLLLPVLIIFEMGTLLSDEWLQSRYMFFLTFPMFLLLSAESLARLLQVVWEWVSNIGIGSQQRAWLRAGAPLAALGLIVAMWGYPTWDLASARATGDYDTAFEYVLDNWQPGDRIMTEFPAAAWLYTGQNDFYANQTSAKVLDGEAGQFEPIDRYTGTPLVETVEALNTTLAQGDRIWFVVGDRHLLGYYDPLFRQQIFAQMDLVYQAGSKYVLVSRPHPSPLPAEPPVPLAGNFNNAIHLAGYSLDPATISPDGVVPLGLYWQPIGPPPASLTKVFVQLRDGQNQTIAQADHFIYERLLTGREWNDLRDNGEWLRDSADLQLPLPLPNGAAPYRIYIGFYNPDTFERVPVIGDTSGENAVVIDLSALPGLVVEAQPSIQN